MDSTLAIWLVPIDPFHTWFADEIRRLSARYQTPDFDPHLTVHAGPDGVVASEAELIGDLALSAAPVTLKLRGVGHSEVFTKCVYVEFEMNEELLGIATRLTERVPSDYILQPHVTLLYNTLPESMRAPVAEDIQVPFTEVTFGAVQAVVCPANSTTPEAVLQWKLLEQRALNAAGM
jgi:2'-5' RNA ligase